MNKTAELLDLAQKKMGLTSDNKLAQALGWPQGTVSGYRRGARCMDVENVAEFSMKTGIPLEAVISAAVEDKKALKKNGRGRKGQISLPLHA